MYGHPLISTASFGIANWTGSAIEDFWVFVVFMF